MSVYFLEFFFRSKKRNFGWHRSPKDELLSAHQAQSAAQSSRLTQPSSERYKRSIARYSFAMNTPPCEWNAFKRISSTTSISSPPFWEKMLFQGAHFAAFGGKHISITRQKRRRRKDRACERQERDATQHSNRNTLRACNSIIVSLSFARSSSPTISFPPFSFALFPFYA